MIRQAMILARCLAHDPNLEGRVGKELLIALLYRPGDKASAEAAEQAGREFHRLQGITVRGLKVRTIQIAYVGAAALDWTLVTPPVAAIYVCQGLDADVAAIRAVVRRRGVLSMGAREAYVRQGLSLGVFLVEGRPTITVNVAALRAEGIEIDSDVLRLAKVVQ